MGIDLVQNYETDSDKAVSSPPSESESGSGGGDMDVWGESRDQILASLSDAPRSTENVDKVLPPGAMVDSGYTIDSERPLGTSVEGKALTPKRESLSGSVEIMDAETGEHIGSASVAGYYIMSIPPSPVIQKGDNTTNAVTSLDAKFVPVADGVSRVVEDIQYPNGSYLGAAYGVVGGYVTDVTGEPIEGEMVIGSGATTATDTEGYYELLVPGGSAVDLTSIEGSVTQSVSITEFSSTQLDWAFPGIKVSVYGPDYNPVRNAPVTIGEKVYRTDSTGVALAPALKAQEWDVTVMDQITRPTTLQDEGELDKIRIVGSARIEVAVRDADSGDEVVDLLTVDHNSGVTSYTNEEGTVSLIALDEATFEVIVGAESKRYKTTKFTESLTEGEVATLKATVEKKPAITNR